MTLPVDANRQATRERPFAGRTAELAVLAAALERASAGEAAVVVVAGEAGMGKTSLVRELLAHAAGAGALVLEGACLELSASAAYLPLVEALGRAARTLPGELREALA